MNNKNEIAELKKLGYDEEDIALMTDDELWENINRIEVEGDFTEWQPGMFTQSVSAENVEKASAKPRNTSRKPSMMPSPNLRLIRTAAQT